MSKEDETIETLRRLRGELGLSQEQVARENSIALKTLSRWESSGRVNPAKLKALLAYYQRVAGGDSPDNDVPRETSDDAWRPNPALRNLIPSRAYDVAIDYCRRLIRAKQPLAFIEEAERLMIDGRYAQMNKRGGRELSETDWIKIVDATWEVIREILEIEGVHV